MSKMPKITHIDLFFTKPLRCTMSNKFNNPVSTAITTALAGAAGVATGAAMRGNSVHNEALTILAGGAITGAIAGLVGCCIPETDKDFSRSAKFAIAAAQATLGLAATLTAQLMGEACLHLHTNWDETVKDQLAGTAAITAGVLAVGATVACVAGLLSTKCCGFFGRSGTAPAAPDPAPMVDTPSMV